MSACIVIAVLNGIEISHKLFTPEMVADALAIRDSGTVLGLPLCRYTQYSCGLGLLNLVLFTSLAITTTATTNTFGFCLADLFFHRLLQV